MQRYKYPRTYHLPYSENRGSDDKTLPNDSLFHGKKVVVMEKYDGENTTVYHNYLHARSIDSIKDESHHWIDRLRATIEKEIPKGYRICGENMFYKHTIFYDDLPSMFLAYSIWDQENKALSWGETKALLEKLHLSYPTIIYEGIYQKEKIVNAFKQYQNKQGRAVEGFVVRIEERFSYEEFSNSLAKFVSKEFIIDTPLHWRNAPKIYNQLTNNRHVWEELT